jgi:hypothetical protein
VEGLERSLSGIGVPEGLIVVKVTLGNAVTDWLVAFPLQPIVNVNTARNKNSGFHRNLSIFPPKYLLRQIYITLPVPAHPLTIQPPACDNRVAYIPYR